MAERKGSSASKGLTFEQLKKKTVPEKTIEIEIGGNSFEWRFRAISGNRLDALQTKYPPNKEQRARGMGFNPEKFGPAIVAACSVEPELTEEEAMELWTSEEWTTGELNVLFNTCTDLCMGGFQVPPTVSV